MSTAGGDDRPDRRGASQDQARDEVVAEAAIDQRPQFRKPGNDGCDPVKRDGTHRDPLAVDPDDLNRRRWCDVQQVGHYGTTTASWTVNTPKSPVVSSL